MSSTDDLQNRIALSLLISPNPPKERPLLLLAGLRYCPNARGIGLRPRNVLHLRDLRLVTATEQAPNDAALMAAVRGGHQDAMAHLYDRYSSVVYSVALRVLGETAAAEDVLQEIFMQLWRNPSSFDASRGNLAPWLAVIARNRALDVLRKRKPQVEIEETTAFVEPDLAAEADRTRAAEKVRSTLKQMPAVQRTALEMAYFEGYSHSEISEKTGEPLGTVKTRIRTGLMMLRKAVEIA